MSETGTAAASAPAPEPTLIEQDGAPPESTILPTEPVEVEAEALKEPEKAAEAPKAPDKPKRTPWYQERINELTAQKTKERVAREAAEAKLAALAPKPDAEQPKPFDPKEFEGLIEQRAQSLLAQKDMERRSRGFLEAGEKEFGATAFQEKCNEVAALGAGDSREFMQLVTDADVLPDGHKVVAALADHPEEAQRILAMDPIKMAGALVRFASTIKPPEKQISNAPAPIKPVGGTAKASEPSDTMTMEQWIALRNKTARVSAGGKRN